MSAGDQAAIEAARARRSRTGVQFDGDTAFVEKVLDWLIRERAGGRLQQGAPLTLVQFNFAPPVSAGLGECVDLMNGQAVQGSVHLCADSLRHAQLELSASNLLTVVAHQQKLQQKQLAESTTVTFDPSTKVVQIRLKCMPMPDPIEMSLMDQPSQLWTGINSLGDALDDFHSQLEINSGLGLLLMDEGGPRALANTFYRNAMYLHLRYILGLSKENGYRVTARDGDVMVTHLPSNAKALVVSTGTRSIDPSAAMAMLQDVLDRATDAFANENAAAHISCIWCPDQHSPTQECASPPLSLRHRHIEAA